jgi:hypothetical protein
LGNQKRGEKARMNFYGKSKTVTFSLKFLAAAVMLSQPLIVTADEIFLKNGHEITCKADGTPEYAGMPLPVFFTWGSFRLTIMHGAHLVYFCKGETEKVSAFGEKEKTRDQITGQYDCSLISEASLEMWEYPTTFSVNLPPGHNQAEHHVCSNFINKELKLAPQVKDPFPLINENNGFWRN